MLSPCVFKLRTSPPSHQLLLSPSFQSRRRRGLRADTALLMGGCCSKEEDWRGRRRDPACPVEQDEEEEGEGEGEDGARAGHGGARVRLKGSCEFASLYTQQGWKGVNQDAMTVWEDFGGDRDAIFCGIFDGHGPLGHKVSSHVRDALPARLYFELNPPNHDPDKKRDDDGEHTEDPNDDTNVEEHRWISSLKTAFIKAFEELDKELGLNSSIDCICSGTTAVSLIKQREHLIIANLGDSRAVLCTRDEKNRPIPIQLTVDLKPNLPSEAERIAGCKGRVFALEEEPDVHRMWLPDDDSPGLAMARAFGDFCLKDFGLISTPVISHRKLTKKDEFVVLATDGVWDVLSNKDVVKIVSSATKRSDAAKNLVERAVRAWRTKHPTSKVDDCAVICLFLKDMPLLKPARSRKLSTESFKTARTESYDTAFNEEIPEPESVAKEEWTALEGMSRVNSFIRIPHLASMLSRRKRSEKVVVEEDQEQKEEKEQNKD